MRLLFITMLNSDEKNGGFVYRRAIGQVLSNIVGCKNLDIITSELDDTSWNGRIVYRIKHYSLIKDKVYNLLSGNITQISRKDVNSICSLILKNKYSYVIFGCSETGNLIKKVKKTGVKTITCYNDIIADAVKRKLQLKRKLSYLPIAILEKRAEGKDIKYCDTKIALNQRDSDLMVKYWGKGADVLIPICLEDTYQRGSLIASVTESLKLLFVGSYYWSANPEGIIWFCKNVMFELRQENVILEIVGYGMENLNSVAEIRLLDNVVILGTVDDIGRIYEAADVVVAPILTGTGMKTKIAEALMHGKKILASREALEGYVGLEDSLCETSQEYLKKIHHLILNRPNKFHVENRRLYEKYYSVKAMENKLKELILE